MLAVKNVLQRSCDGQFSDSEHLWKVKLNMFGNEFKHFHTIVGPVINFAELSL